MATLKQMPFLILLLHILALFIYHHLAYLGHYGFDDLHYAKLASNFNQGILDFSDHYTHRLPILLLTAASYFMLGITDFSSALPALLMSSLILGIVYHILRKGKLTTLILALSLTTFSQWFIFYSDKLMPDIYVAFAMMLSLFIIYKYKFDSSKKQAVLYAFLLSLALLFGFMSKGTIILFLPVLMYLCLLDLIHKRDVKFWLATVLSGITVLAIYFLLIAYYTGDFASRFEAISANSYLNSCSYDQQPLMITLKRIAYGFVNLMTANSVLTVFIFVFAMLFKKGIGPVFSAKDPFSFFLTAAVLLFLSANFMTISPTAYIPMCLDVRHFLFLIPVAAIPAAAIINDFIERKQYATQIIASLFLVTLLSWFLPGNTFWKLYFPLSVLFGVYCFLKINPIYKKLFLGFFIIILLFALLENFQYAQKVAYNEQKRVLQEEILNKYDHCYIITNEVQKRLGDYYLGFERNDQRRFLRYHHFNIDSLDNRRKFLFLNWHTEFLSGLEQSDLPQYAQKDERGSKRLLYEDRALNLFIYEVEHTDFAMEKGPLLLHSFNDFEKPLPYWLQKETDLSKAVKYQGDQASRMNEYSTTFSFPLDSLKLEGYEKLLISSKSFCYFFDETAAKLVLSIEDANSAYIWKAKDVNKDIHAYTNWWPVQFKTTISVDEIKKGSLLKIYIWNKTKQEAYLDNFEISVRGIKKER